MKGDPLSIPCPACLAPAGSPCRQPTEEQARRGLKHCGEWAGRIRRPHGSRAAIASGRYDGGRP